MFRPPLTFSAIRRSTGVRFIFLTLAALILLLSGAQPTGTRADIATPRNFVSGIHCTSLIEATVAFVIPGTIDLTNKLGRTPDQIWVDLSVFDNNFAVGTFLGAGPLVARAPLSEQVYYWMGVYHTSTHYYRLNGLFNGEWREIGRGTFRTPDCAPLVEMFCEAGGSMSAKFSVGPASFGEERSAIEQWIDLSIFGNPSYPEFDNGFPAGTFIGAGPFPVAGFDFEWRGLLPGVRHYSRVNVLHAGPPLIGSTVQWEQILGSRFTSLDCRDLPHMIVPDI